MHIKTVSTFVLISSTSVTISEYNVDAVYIGGDLSDPKDVKALYDGSVKSFPGGIDILVNNAGEWLVTVYNLSFTAYLFRSKLFYHVSSTFLFFYFFFSYSSFVILLFNNHISIRFFSSPSSFSLRVFTYAHEHTI